MSIDGPITLQTIKANAEAKLRDTALCAWCLAKRRVMKPATHTITVDGTPTPLCEPHARDAGQPHD